MIKLCSSFLKADKSGTEIDQACNSCCIPGFCASIVLAFISGVELFDYVVDGRGGGGGSERAWLGEKAKWWIWSQDGGIKLSRRCGCHTIVQNF